MAFCLVPRLVTQRAVPGELDHTGSSYVAKKVFSQAGIVLSSRRVYLSPDQASIRVDEAPPLLYDTLQVFAPETCSVGTAAWRVPHGKERVLPVLHVRGGVSGCSLLVSSPKL